MGPLRTAWTFPYTGKELIKACKEREAEELQAREIDEHRESLRNAGVKNWENAFPDTVNQRAYQNPASSMRERQGKAKRALVETQRFRRQLEHDLAREEHRLYKLTIDDVIYFGL